MPRPQSKIDEYKDEIIARWSIGDSIEAITEWLSHLIPISQRTLERRLKTWDLHRHSRTTVTPQTLDFIRYLVFHHGYNDKSILRELSREGVDLSPRGLQVVRLRHNIKRRYRTDEERNEVLLQAQNFMENAAQYSSSIQYYGISDLYKFMQTRAGILVGRNRIYQIYKDIYPEHVQRRREAGWNHRTEFQVPGPNWLWSLDGYAKLSDFGFQVCRTIHIYIYIYIYILIIPIDLRVHRCVF